MRLLALERFFILRIRETFGKLKSIKGELADTYDKKNRLENKALSCKDIKDSRSFDYTYGTSSACAAPLLEL